MDESDFTTLWRKATLALDANVLPHLYRYPAAAREDLLAVLRPLSPRLLVPYQAALEYQRGRLPTIAAQRSRFSEVRKLLSDTQNHLQSGLDGFTAIGPRPELIEEVKREGGVRLFYMYNSEQFIRFAKQYLGVDVKTESIDQIKNVRRYLGVAEEHTAELAVFEWLKRIHSGKRVLVHRRFPDYIVELEGGEFLGYEVKLLRSKEINRRIRDALSQNHPNLKRLYIVFVAVDASSQEFAQAVVPSQTLPSDVSVVLGHLEAQSDDDEDDDGEESTFVADFEYPRPFSWTVDGSTSLSKANSGEPSQDLRPVSRT